MSRGPETGRRRPWLPVGLGVLLAAVGAVSFTQAAKLDYDFHHFYQDAAYVRQHGQLNPDLDNPERSRRRRLPFYLPVVALLLSPLTVGGVQPAAGLWTLAQLIALTYSLKVLADWGRAQGSRAPPMAALVIATCVALPAIYETARFNQVSFFVLALVLAGVASLERRRPMRAGIWLGLATVFKLLPGIFALWLVLKRQWTALGTLAVTVVVVALLPPLFVFGPRDTAKYHRQWWDYNFHGPAARGMVAADLRAHFVDHRNQSIPAVVARFCWSEHPHGAAFQPVTLDELTCRRLSQGITILLAIVLIWLTRRSIPRGMDVLDAKVRDRFRIEVAVYLLAMLVFSPLLRTYYLVWALPALVLLARFALDERTRLPQRLGRIGLALWLLGMLAWVSNTARTGGVHLIVLIALAGILLGLGSVSSAYTSRKIKQAL